MKHHRRGRMTAAFLDRARTLRRGGELGARRQLRRAGRQLLVGHRDARLLAELRLPARAVRLPVPDQAAPPEHDARTSSPARGAKTGDVLANQISRVNARRRTSSRSRSAATTPGSRASSRECAKPAGRRTAPGDVTTAQNYIRNTLPGQLNSVYSQIKSRAAATAKRRRARLPAHLQWARTATPGRCSAPTTRHGSTRPPTCCRAPRSGRAAAYGFTFKSAIPAFIGHAVCDNPEWLNGLSNPVGDSYHPNRLGHSSGYAPLVRAVIG